MVALSMLLGLLLSGEQRGNIVVSISFGFKYSVVTRTSPQTWDQTKPEICALTPGPGGYLLEDLVPRKLQDRWHQDLE